MASFQLAQLHSEHKPTIVGLTAGILAGRQMKYKFLNFVHFRKIFDFLFHLTKLGTALLQ